MIIINDDSKAKKLCANSLCFGKTVKIVEKYRKARPGLICIRYCRVGYKQLGNFGDRPKKYLLFAGSH